MKRVSMMCMVVALFIVCTGCSSSYLPHNAVKYIPELAQERYEEYREEDTELESKLGGNGMRTEHLKTTPSYFSPSSIRGRYEQHLKEETIQNNDPLLDVVCDSIKLMRDEGKSGDEIRGMLKEHYHFSDEIIEKLLKESI